MSGCMYLIQIPYHKCTKSIIRIISGTYVSSDTKLCRQSKLSHSQTSPSPSAHFAYEEVVW